MNNNDTTAAAIAKLAHVYEGHMRPADALETATTVVSGWTTDHIAAYALAAQGCTVSEPGRLHPATGALVFPVTFPETNSGTTRHVSTVAYVREGRIEIAPSAVSFPGPRRAMLAAQREARDILDAATA